MPDELYFKEFDPDSSFTSRIQGWVFSNKWAVLSASFGLIFLLSALFFLNSGSLTGEKVEVLGASESVSDKQETKIMVEIAGQVQKPGVFELKSGDRIEQLLVSAGGLSVNADREWIEKNLNRAAKLSDGQKVYIPKKGEVSLSQSLSTSSGAKTSVAGAQTGLVNINTASLKELDSLSGIGATRAQAIIDNRPYSASDELVSKKVIPKSVFDKIKDRISI